VRQLLLTAAVACQIARSILVHFGDIDEGCGD